jgi:hypothetical protein
MMNFYVWQQVFFWQHKLRNVSFEFGNVGGKNLSAKLVFDNFKFG